MSYTTVDDSSAFFHVQTYAGSGANQDVVNDAHSGDFKPDLLVVKNRSNGSYGSNWYDSNRGVKKYFYTDQAYGDDQEQNNVQGNSSVQLFNTNGFRGGSSTNVFEVNWINGIGSNYVAWQWQINGGTTTSVSASGTGNGCVNACEHQANTTAGVSIITYTGRDDQLNNGQHSLLKHGLGVAPDFIIIKRRDADANWRVMGKEVTSASAYSNNEYLELNTTAGINGNSYTGSIAPTSTDIYLGNELVNVASGTYVAYAFSETQGFSKFGSYIGSGNRSQAPFIYTGFQPAFIMVKDTVSAHGWSVFDNRRIIANGDMHYLAMNKTDAESGTGFSHVDPVDFMSNGFRVMNADAWMNTVNRKYIYMAFAQHPFVSSTGIPTTAR